MSLAAKLRRRTAPAGEVIVRQGGSGSSLFLVARGVIRVSRQEGGVNRDLATLIAGEFFGEMALLHGIRRTATCRAMTPCALSELRRDDIDVVRRVCPEFQRALEEADRQRRAKQRVSPGAEAFHAEICPVSYRYSRDQAKPAATGAAAAPHLTPPNPRI